MEDHSGRTRPNVSWVQKPLFGRSAGSGRLGRGSVYFNCYKTGEEITFLTCLHCPHSAWGDWGTGQDDCRFKIGQDEQRIREIEEERLQEKREFEQLLRENEEDNRRMREMWERELREYEPKRQRIIKAVEKSLLHPYRVEILPPEDKRINWDYIDGIDRDEAEEESLDEDDGDREG